MKKGLLIFFFFALSTLNSIGQNATDECGTDEVHNYLMRTDSNYRKQLVDMESAIKTIIQNQATNKLQTSVYTIPVVVHVIHLGEAVGTGSNISNAQVQGAISGLNDRFANIIGSGLNVEINFCLAVRDPSGNPTTGINRVDGSGVANYSSDGISMAGCAAGANEYTIKDLSKWTVSDYYNIWVVNKICNGIWAGYAYYPFGGAYDGTTVDKGYMTNSSTVLTHEVGHGFYAYHTFEGDGGNVSCPSDVSCIDNGDRVCDTPPHKQNDCGVSNPCSGSGIWDNSRFNYMSYCGTKNRFTQGQKDRMRAAAVVYPRATLLSSLGCVPVTATDAAIEEIAYPIQVTYTTKCTTPDSISPIIKLKNIGTDTLKSVVINYKLDGGILNSFSWSGSLAKNSFTNVTLPLVSISTGAHTFLSYSTNPNGGADSYVYNDSANISFTYNAIASLSASNSVINPTCYGDSSGSVTVTPVSKVEIIEDFEGTTDWTVVNGSQINKWFVGSDIANGGVKSIYISNNNDTNLYTNTMSSIVYFYKDFDFPAGATSITLKFDWKCYGENFLDFLRLYLSHTSVIPAAGNYISGSIIGNNYSVQNSWTTATITGLDANAGLSKRLVCSWFNNSNGGVQTPAAIDNIIVSYTTSGSTPYNYSWNTIPVQTTVAATGLPAGTYSVTVTDANGCSATSSATVTAINPLPTTPTISATIATLTSSAPTGNQWYLNGNIIVGATSPSYTVTVNGNYTVVVTDGNGCSATSAPYSFTTIGIPELTENNDVIIIPNPSDGQFHVTVNNLNPGKIKIFNTIGEIIYQSESVDTEINLFHQPEGMYFMEVKTEEKTYYKKLIIQK